MEQIKALHLEAAGTRVTRTQLVNYVLISIIKVQVISTLAAEERISRRIQAFVNACVWTMQLGCIPRNNNINEVIEVKCTSSMPIIRFCAKF
jgi:hypothetical protein